MNQKTFELYEMEAMIGGSSLDDLRDLMNIDQLEDGDIIFKIIPDLSIDLTQSHPYIQKIYGINPGQTFIATCLKHITPDYKYVVSDFQPNSNHQYFEWEEL